MDAVTLEGLGERLEAYHDHTKAELGKLSGTVKDLAAISLRHFDDLPPGGRPPFASLPQLAGDKWRGREDSQSLGAIVTESEEFRKFDRNDHRASAQFSAPLSAVISPIGAGGAPALAKALVEPDRRPDPILMPRYPLRLRDLFSWLPTASGSVIYPKQTGRQLNADTVAELALKPQSDMGFAELTTPLQVIAHWVWVSKQALEDAPVLRSIIDDELLYGLRLKEEQQLLFGDGAGSNLTGIMPNASAFDPSLTFKVTNATYFDILLQAVAQCERALLPATGIVLNPDDANLMLAIKDANSRYIGSGPFAQTAQRLWELPWVKSYSMPKDNFCVGAFLGGAQGFTREDVNTLISYEDRDNFINNRATILCEERLCLVVKLQQAFVKGTFTAAKAANNAA